MTLKEACEIADECGLETIGEAIANIEYHVINLFTYDKIEEEVHELYMEARRYSPKTNIKEWLNNND